MKYATLQKLLKVYPSDKPEEEKLEASLTSNVELFHLRMLSDELRERGLSGKFQLILPIDDFNRLVPIGHKSWAEGDYATIVPDNVSPGDKGQSSSLPEPVTKPNSRQRYNPLDHGTDDNPCWECYKGLCKDH